MNAFVSILVAALSIALVVMGVLWTVQNILGEWAVLAWIVLGFGALLGVAKKVGG